MNKYYITFEKDGLRRDIFLLGYSKDGGYFISDLSERKGRYLILRLKVHLRGFGSFSTPTDKNNEWITSWKPKLMCHADGTSHVSGSGIRSGFYKFFRKHKGVSTRSPRFNDGGPAFGLMYWDLTQFPNSKKGRNQIIFDSTNMHVDPYLLDMKGPPTLKYDAHIFEGFYLPINALKHLNLATGIIRYKHPNFGIIPLRYIPPPPNSPGFIAIAHRATCRGFKSDYGFIYGGGVSRPDSEGKVTSIKVLFPVDENDPRKGFDKHRKTLDFNLKNKLLSRLDDFLSRASQMWNKTR